MKRANREFFFGLCVAALASNGCGPDQERRLVFTAPREARVDADARARSRAKPPTVKAEVPAGTPNPPSNGVDVPIIQPE